MKENDTKKKDKVDEDFDESLLPKTRREQFKYLLKTKFSKTIATGGLMALFAIPSLIISIIKIYYMSGIMSSYDPNVEEEFMKMILAMRNTLLIFDSIQILGLMIFAIGVAGAMKVIKQICFDEVLFIKKDFFQGIKENAKHYILISLLISPIILIFNFLMHTGTLTNNQTLKIALVIFIGLYGFTIIPILTMMISSISVYQNTFSGHFKNSAVIVLKHYFPYVLFSFIFIAGIIIIYVLANVVSNGGIYIPVVALIILYLLPLFLIANELYSLSRFDLYINKDYPSIYRKGLSK